MASAPSAVSRPRAVSSVFQWSSVPVCAACVTMRTWNCVIGRGDARADGPACTNPSARMRPPNVRFTSGSRTRPANVESPCSSSDIGTTEYALRWYHVSASAGCVSTVSPDSHTSTFAGARCMVQVDCSSSPVSTCFPSRHVSNATVIVWGRSDSPTTWMTGRLSSTNTCSRTVPPRPSARISMRPLRRFSSCRKYVPPSSGFGERRMRMRPSFSRREISLQASVRAM